MRSMQEKNIFLSKVCAEDSRYKRQYMERVLSYKMSREILLN